MICLAVALVSVCLAIGTGLASPSPHGAGDNGDGVRLYCGAGIVPATPDREAKWKGLVVSAFRTGEQPCARPMPSSALVPLIVAGRWSGPILDLRTVAWIWVGIVVAAFGAAAAAAGVVHPWRALVVLPAAVPLASPVFSRFLLSTYGEPAGLVGTAIAFAGIGAAVAGPPRGAGRMVALAVTVLGGVIAATAKPAYVVVLLPVLAVCVLLPPAGSRLLGTLLALAVAVGAAFPVSAALGVQDAEYGAVNTHDLLFTAVGPASDGDALTALDLPPKSRRALGSAYYLDGGAAVPDWGALVGAHWPRLRTDTLEYVLSHPGTAFRMVDSAFRATSDPRVSYLPSDLAGVAGARPTTRPAPTLGEQGADGSTFQPWLATRPWGFLPWLVLGAAIALAAVGVATRRRAMNRSLGALGVTAAATMGLLAISAVIGDGYFELPKHTWLAAYSGAVAVVALIPAGAVLLARSIGGFAAPVGLRGVRGGRSQRDRGGRP